MSFCDLARRIEAPATRPYRGGIVYRYETIRTGRIHQQFVNVRSYAYGLILLVPITLIFVANADLFLATGGQGGEALAEAELPDVGTALESSWLLLHRTSRAWLQGNLMAYVFFSGLAGGFLSVASRIRDRGLEPGQDAYATFFVLTKPFVGAFAACVLYVI
jgi:hypothetical protein